MIQRDDLSILMKWFWLKHQQTPSVKQYRTNRYRQNILVKTFSFNNFVNSKFSTGNTGQVISLFFDPLHYNNIYKNFFIQATFNLVSSR